MGGLVDVPSASLPETENDYVLVSNTPESSLSFNPASSYMISFGIDVQTHPSFKAKSLGNTVKLDALELTFTLVKNYHLEKFEVNCASDDNENCTHAGIRKRLEESVRQVGDEGLLVVFFGGHGINDSNTEWALAPSDFDHTPKTCLTSAMLNECFNSPDSKAKHIIIILDCCFSGIMATDLMKDLTLNNAPALSNIYVIAAGTDQESSLAVGTLRHSIFSYFLKYALVQKCPRSTLIPPGSLPLREVFEECRSCCDALSSLVLSIDKNTKELKLDKTTPSLSYFNPVLREGVSEEGVEEVDAAAAERLSFIMELMQKHRCKPSPSLHIETFQWLSSIVKVMPSPLFILDEKGLLDDSSDNGRVLKAVISLIMQSIALIEYVNNKETAAHPFVFLIAFVHTVSTIDMVHQSLPVEIDHLLEAWPMYCNALKKYGVDDTEMKSLLKDINELKNSQTT